MAESLRLVEELAAVGLAAVDVMRCLGWTSEDLELNLDVLPQLDEALKRGRARAKHAVMAVVFAKAMKGDLGAARLYLSAHAGWNAREELPADKFDLDEKTFAREGNRPAAKAGEGVDAAKLGEWEEAITAHQKADKVPAA